MERSGSHSLKDIVNLLLRQQGLEVPLYEYRLLSTWHEVIDPALAKYITEAFIKGQVLYLKVNSSVARNELFLHRREWVQKLNQHVGYQVISAIQLG